jgi:spore maturation protein CgeB
MKILIISDGHAASIYDGAFARGFDELGHEVYRFTWKEYFKHYQYSTQYEVDDNRLKSIYYRAQNKLTFGPALWKINKDILKKCLEIKPDLVFIYRGTHVNPNTMKKIKEKVGCKVFGYNNDDPFSSSYPAYFWRHYKNGVKYYDHIFSYRYKNIEDYKAMGYEKVSLLRSYYLNDSNFYIEDLPTKQYKCDVVFIGHYEDDGRDDAIKLLIDNNIDVKLYGTLWNNSKYFRFFEDNLGKIMPLYEDYNLGLNSAKIALVFLSKKNNDTYTRRCFEIPATKTMMVSEYTDDLNSVFEQGKEAEYFRDKEELLKKIQYYLCHKDELNTIGENGYQRLIIDGHEVVNRCMEVLKVYEEIQ